MDRTPVIPPRLWIPALICAALLSYMLPRIERANRTARALAAEPSELGFTVEAASADSGREVREQSDPPPSLPEERTVAPSSPPDPLEPTLEPDPSTAAAPIFQPWAELSLAERVAQSERSAVTARALELAGTLFREVGADRGACSLDRWSAFLVFLTTEIEPDAARELASEIDSWCESLDRLVAHWRELGGPVQPVTVAVVIQQRFEQQSEAPFSAPAVLVADRELRGARFVWVIEHSRTAPLGANVERAVLAAALRAMVAENGDPPLPEWVVLGLVEGSRRDPATPERFVGLHKLLARTTQEHTERLRDECESMDPTGQAWNDWWASAAAVLQWIRSGDEREARTSVVERALRKYAETGRAELVSPDSLAESLGFETLAVWEECLRTILPDPTSGR